MDVVNLVDNADFIFNEETPDGEIKERVLNTEEFVEVVL